MRIKNPEAVVSALETGLGGIREFEGFRPDMRLRMSGVCGLGSVALREHMPGTRLVLSQPNLSVDPDATHVFAIVPYASSEIVIDASFTHLLAYAGLTPGYIQHGGIDNYPADKIAVFPYGHSEDVVAQLTTHARITLDTYVKPEDYRYNSRREFEGMDDRAIASEFARVWDPGNLTDYVPDRTNLEGGRMIAQLIDPEDLRLID